MIDKIIKNERYKSKVVPITLFLVIELMLLVAFNLGNLGIAYRGIALVLAVILLPNYFKTLGEDLAKGFLFVFLPLVLYLLTVVFSPVFLKQNELIPSQSVTLLNRGFFSLLMTFVGALAFFLLGYFVSNTKVLAKNNFIYLIYGGISMLLLISLLATLINYGFFHTVIYQGKVNFYEAVAYPISTQANLLLGFSIQTVERHVLTTLALLALTPIFGLMFMRDNKRKLYLYALIGFAIIGALTLLDFVAYKDLIFLLPALLLAIMLKFNLHKKKYFKHVMFTGLGLILLAIFVGVLASFEVSFIVKLLESNALTKKLFYNGYVQKYMGIIKEAFDFRYIFGNPYIYTEYLPIYQTFPSGNLLLDIIRETGLMGGLFFVLFIIVSVKIIIAYVKSDKDNTLTKFLILGFLVTLFTRYMVFYPFNQLAFKDSYWHINYFPFVESKEFAICLFLIGYMYVTKSTNLEEKERLQHAQVK